jgi:ABC-type dipeptide/oligopeptide/nickel transport system permease subunit
MSFLGVGLQEPDASLGSLLTAAADVALLDGGQAWQRYMLLTPAMAITLFVFGVRLIGEGMERDGE